MHAKPWYRGTLLAASFLAASAGGAALGDETSASVTILRGTQSVVQQPRRQQEIQMMPPLLPSCPEGYVYSLMLSYCYQPRDPMYAR